MSRSSRYPSIAANASKPISQLLYARRRHDRHRLYLGHRSLLFRCCCQSPSIRSNNQHIHVNSCGLWIHPCCLLTDSKVYPSTVRGTKNRPKGVSKGISKLSPPSWISPTLSGTCAWIHLCPRYIQRYIQKVWIHPAKKVYPNHPIWIHLFAKVYPRRINDLQHPKNNQK